MKSGMTMRRDIDGAIVFEGRVEVSDFPRLDPFDSALVNECDAEGSTAADWLLALECIFRRAEQQAPNV